MLPPELAPPKGVLPPALVPPELEPPELSGLEAPPELAPPEPGSLLAAPPLGGFASLLPPPELGPSTEGGQPAGSTHSLGSSSRAGRQFPFRQVSVAPHGTSTQASSSSMGSSRLVRGIKERARRASMQPVAASEVMHSSEDDCSPPTIRMATSLSRSRSGMTTRLPILPSSHSVV